MLSLGLNACNPWSSFGLLHMYGMSWLASFVILTVTLGKNQSSNRFLNEGFLDDDDDDDDGTRNIDKRRTRKIMLLHLEEVVMAAKLAIINDGPEMGSY